MALLNKQNLPFIGSSYNFVGAHHGDTGVSMFLVEAEPGRGAPLHQHPYDEIALIQEGHSRLVLGDEIQDAGPGDIVVIKAGTPHGFINAGDTVLKQIDIHVNPVFEQENLEPTASSLKANLPNPKPQPK
ncbi:MAG TPA: cupin domain-containing protein [Terracidiphilus sp.]|jgi:quercetin dioxygenase-like cupin family protein|nr:cupin domain-containing protein [Terracidiphilus sp.]